MRSLRCSSCPSSQATCSPNPWVRPPVAPLDVHFGLPEVNLGPACLTIGSYDGVHRAHQHVIRCTREAAVETGSQAALLTFEPHPRCVIDPANCPSAITTLK